MAQVERGVASSARMPEWESAGGDEQPTIASSTNSGSWRSASASDAGGSRADSRGSWLGREPIGDLSVDVCGAQSAVLVTRQGPLWWHVPAGAVKAPRRPPLHAD